jgi:glyoxylase-like metal-dependent hydrolase (beta-lactamase superfamily II)
MADEPFLVDSGRYGQGQKLVGMMASVGIKPEDLVFVLISHGHEDHDGGLAELVSATNLRVKAHAIYDLIIRQYPKKAPPGHKQGFPAKCWHCPMPEAFFTRNCLGYHKVLQQLEVDRIADGMQQLGTEIRTYHLPGHSPDCLAVRIGDEAIIVGDIILPDITPWPTREAMYDDIAAVINRQYADPSAIFGLKRYIKSLKKLGAIASAHPEMAVLPAHRLYFRDRWNGIDLGQRVRELLHHHVDRCGAILEILNAEPKTADEIAGEYFPEHLLKGNGRLMAVNEVISHCELMRYSGDVIALANNHYKSSGSSNCEGYIRSLQPEG